MKEFNDQWHSDKCLTCKHSGADPDSAYCGHVLSLAATNGYGQGISLARSNRGVCKPQAKLYEKCTCKDKYCPRHQRRTS